MKKNVFYGLLAFIMAGLVLSTASSAQAGGLGEKVNMTERKEMILDALQDGDFDAWAGLVNDTKRGGKILSVINEDNFQEYAELQVNLIESREAFSAFMEELGFKPKPPLKKGIMGKFKAFQRWMNKQQQGPPEGDLSEI